MATVSLEKVSKTYPNGAPAVSDLDLEVAEGELMVMVGPSGSGKTTALRMVAGLEDITSGTLRLGGQVVNDLSPKDRNVAMVFQSYALYPHMTVAENIGFALRLRKMPKDQIQAKVAETAQLLGLSEYLDRKPGQLSGGQRQRVAMGRAVVREPSVFLMDEPLSNLDAKMRVQMRSEISRIQRRVGVATLYVTHDQTEAMTMGDRVAVLHMGCLAAVRHPPGPLRPPRQPLRGRLHRLAGHEPVRGRPVGRRRPAAAGQPVDHPARRRAGRPPRPRPVPGQAVGAGRAPRAPLRRALGGTPATGTSLVVDVELIEALGNELQVHFLIDAAKAESKEAKAATETEELAGLPMFRAPGPSRPAWPAVLAPLGPERRLPGHPGRRHRPAPLLRPHIGVGHLELKGAGSPVPEARAPPSGLACAFP